MASRNLDSASCQFGQPSKYSRVNSMFSPTGLGLGRFRSPPVGLNLVPLERTRLRETAGREREGQGRWVMSMSSIRAGPARSASRSIAWSGMS